MTSLAFVKAWPCCRICLINVPEHLESITSDWESTHDMPMRERVGPRLSVELAELWS